MISVDQMLNGSRYKDIEVVTLTPTSISARVDDNLVEIDLESSPHLNNDVQNVCVKGTKILRIAQADPRSVRSAELDTPRDSWLVVADPIFESKKEALTPRAFAGAMASLIPNRAQYAAGLTDEEILAYPNVCRIITEAVSDGGQSSSRNGAKVQYFQEHHSTFLSADPYIRMVQTRSREVSSTFAVDGKRIIRLVNLLRRPWTSGSATYDATAFTVETTNSTLAPNYLVSEDSKNSLGRIAAAMAADGALAALTTQYIYLHRQMKSRFGVSYGTACPMDITPEDTIARASKQPIGGNTLSIQEDSMAIVRISDWNGRCYIVNDLGHEYIPAMKEVNGLLKISKQTNPIEINFGDFLPAIARINANLEGSVIANLIRSAGKTAARSFAGLPGAEPGRPFWVDEAIWEEAVARGIQADLQ